jgi:hypothetical protein
VHRFAHPQRPHRHHRPRRCATAEARNEPRAPHAVNRPPGVSARQIKAAVSKSRFATRRPNRARAARRGDRAGRVIRSMARSTGRTAGDFLNPGRPCKVTRTGREAPRRPRRAAPAGPPATHVGEARPLRGRVPRALGRGAARAGPLGAAPSASSPERPPFGTTVGRAPSGCGDRVGHSFVGRPDHRDRRPRLARLRTHPRATGVVEPDPAERQPRVERRARSKNTRVPSSTCGRGITPTSARSGPSSRPPRRARACAARPAVPPAAPQRPTRHGARLPGRRRCSAREPAHVVPSGEGRALDERTAEAATFRTELPGGRRVG